MAERVLVAMSGGVDSAVAAALLLEQGYDVQGVTLRLGADPSTSCCDLGSLDSARAVAAHLGIPHHVWDAGPRFEERVLRPAWEDYARGRTPNPCIQCNHEVKFALLLERAAEHDAHAFATGHYARVEREAGGGLRLRRGADPRKDQTYFLYRMTADQLSRCRFPLGALTKPEVRAQAERLALPCADRPESQDACLVAAEGGFAEALRLRFGAPARDGEIRDPQGRVLGAHPGVHRFTLGQRRGTGVATGQRAYVSAIDAGQGVVTLTTDSADLLSTSLQASDLSWLPGARPEAPCQIAVQVRYRSPAVPARLEHLHDTTAVIRFETPQRAVTPGQAAVIYQGDRCLGGGPIRRTDAGAAAETGAVSGAQATNR